MKKWLTGKNLLIGFVVGVLLATAIPIAAQLINTLRIVPSASTTPSLSATGSGTNVSVHLVPKGGGSVVLGSGAPTCGATGALCTVTGTDGSAKGLIGNPPNWSKNVVFTFATTKAVAPACVVSSSTGESYRYYTSAVTTTTTTATIRLGGGLTATGGWSPGDEFSVICAGTS